MKRTLTIILLIIAIGSVTWYLSDTTHRPASDTDSPLLTLDDSHREQQESDYRFATNHSSGTVKQTSITLTPQYVDRGDDGDQLLSYQDSPQPFLYTGRLGETLTITVQNKMGRPTSVHWHGIRAINKQDGVPSLTQDAIQPHETYTYTITLHDPGLFWFHPHADHEYQIGKGLYGIIYVPSETDELSEDDGFARDFDHILALKDFRLDSEGNISDNIGIMHDRSHGGMIGNYQTINNTPTPSYTLPEGYGIIRLVNTSNARYYSLDLSAFDAYVIGSDGGYIAQAYETDSLLMTPGERYYVAIDTTTLTEDSYTLYDTYYNQRIPLVHFTVDHNQSPSPSHSFPEQISYYVADIPDRSQLTYDTPDQIIALGGRGVMGGSENMIGGVSQERGRMIDHNIITDTDQLAEVGGYQRSTDTLRIIRITNKTSRVHPMHLHGDFFQVIARSDGGPLLQGRKDTVHVAPHEYVDIALIPTNPGKRLFHCHILGHAAYGMKTTIHITD